MKRLTENEIKEILLTRCQANIQAAIAVYGEKVGSLLYDGEKIWEYIDLDLDSTWTKKEIKALEEIEAEAEYGVERYIEDICNDFLYSEKEWDSMDDEEKQEAYEDLI